MANKSKYNFPICGTGGRVVFINEKVYKSCTKNVKIESVNVLPNSAVVEVIYTTPGGRGKFEFQGVKAVG